MIAKSPPTELRAINRGKLVKMNINPQLIDLFINTTVFSPRDQTLLVAALEQCPRHGGDQNSSSSPFPPIPMT